MGRILCAWSPSWAIDNWRRRNPCASPGEGSSKSSTSAQRGSGEDFDPPFTLITAVRGVRVLAAVDQAAALAGLYPGQKATDATARCPELATAESEPEADAVALKALTDWCVRFSPAVAPDGPDGLFLDITGVAHLWGGEAELIADLRTRLAQNGLNFRAAIADTPGAAWALAHFGKDTATVALPGDQAVLLGPLSPAALRLDPEAAAQIERLGLRRIDQLADLPRAPLARRFGAATLDRLDQALGRSKEALTFRRPPNPWFARLAFAEPISAPDDMARVSLDVAAKLCVRLELEGQGAQKFHLSFHRVDGRPQTLTVGLALAGRDPTRIAKLFTPKLETVDPGFGVEVVTLAAEGVEPVAGRQVRLDSLLEPGREESLAPLIDRLTNRLGEGRVWKAAPVESHVPEQSVTHAAPLAVTTAQPWDPERPRPLRLFRKPEPLELVMALTPDDPPRQFQWRRRLHRVRLAEGPERLGDEWWRGDIEHVSTGHVRDYYRVEDQEGARFWVFREGLYSPDHAARWWLHGVFG